MKKLNKKKIIFLTGTRADFGKLKPLIKRLQKDSAFDVRVFVTGMHMLSKYGHTHLEINKSKIKNLYKFVNQNYLDRMDTVLSKTITGFSDYVREIDPDMIIVHGDRVEALAAAIVGSLNNVKVAHIEGGELSGTVDEVIRHAISKISNFHFVSNKESLRRLVQLGEEKKTIYEIGSPDVDSIKSNFLPKLDKVKFRYKIKFDKYAILLFHPITSEINTLSKQIANLIDATIDSRFNYLVIYPNNDHGTEKIFEEFRRIAKNRKFRIIPSMRFEYFLTALKNAQFIIGNSSAGIREAPYFGVPTINIGTRQHNRVKCSSIINTSDDFKTLVSTIKKVNKIKKRYLKLFGSGNSAIKFHKILKKNKFGKLVLKNILKTMPCNSYYIIYV